MYFSKTNTLSGRVLSIFLVCILFLNDLIPFSRACNSLAYENFQVGRYFGSSASNDHLINSPENELVDNSIGEKTAVEISELVQTKTMSNRASTGPNQSETSGFSISSTDGMVDKFTGDFSYSIPLMDVEGYPIRLSYNSNVGMNSEASWVGLGWDLSVGAVSREMRGIPDEFNGEQNITRVFNQKDNNTENGWKAGIYGGAGTSFGGSKYILTGQITALGGGYENSYLGKGITFDFGIQSAFSMGEKWHFGPDFGLGFSIDTKNGVGANHSIGLSAGYAKSEDVKNGDGGVSYGGSFNSRNGVTEKMISLNLDGGYDNTDKEGNAFGGSIGVGSTISFGTATSIPRVQFNEIGSSVNSEFSLYYKNSNGDLFWKAGIKAIDYSTISQIAGDIFNQPAIGYLHSGKREHFTNGYPVMDFNRASEFAFSEEMANLSFSFQTYDFFQVNAMGISGQFRANRDDYGSYYDPTGESEFKGITTDMEAGFEQSAIKEAIAIGVAGGEQIAGIESSSWETSTGYPIEFTSEGKGNSFDNSVYFKAVGESTQSSTEALTMLGGENLNRFKIDGNIADKTMDLTDSLVINPNTTSAINSATVNTSNQKPIIATVFKPIIAADLINNSAFYYSNDENVFYGGSLDQLNRVVANFKVNNHISKLEVVSTDGVKYNYGIPVYNKFYDEVSFSVGGRPVDSGSKLVVYNSGDNSTSNNLGRSNFYDKTTMPAFAHSFLLTEMTSSDYIDRTANGPSLDDMGSYYKFNYTQVYGEKEATGRFYKWRFPVSGGTANEAMHNKGFEGSDQDDIANYTYGQKEIWYTHSVESKNLVAEFHLENRDDAYGVLDENGLLDLNQPLKRIKKIILYNRSERLEKGANAKPLQTVEFEYDYSLCKLSPSNKFSYSPNFDESKSGKLTLIAIRVKTGTSDEMKLAKYEFNYSSENPDFNYANVDAWGNIKVNNSTKPNVVNPYSVQNETVANTNSNAWKMIRIISPMGGTVEIEYEADRYAFVQDQRAMKHMDIHGMTNLIQFLYLQTQNNWNGTDYVGSNFTTDLNFGALTSFFQTVNPSWSGLNLFWNMVFAKNSIKGGSKYTQKYGKFVEQLTPNNVVVFLLDEEIEGALTSAQAGILVKNNYFKKDNISFLKDLYFRMHVNVRETPNVDELVQTFATISDDQINPFDGDLPYQDDFKAIGVMPKDPISGNYKYGYVVLEPVNTGEKESISGEDKEEGGSLTMHPLQKTSLEYVRQNLPDKIYGSCDGCDTDLSIDWKAFFSGDMYKAMVEKGHYVESYINDYSTLRLYVQDSVKYASTARVKRITYKDNWDVISGETATTSTYNWDYIYTNNVGNTGVASYEPRPARDENSLYNWETYIDTKKKFPDETKFSTLKVADPLYPSPLVGYSAVKVLFENSSSKGYSMTEFYTSKDYPTFEDKTDVISPEKIKKVNLLTGKSLEAYGFSQGYLVKTNDYHGKPKVSSLYDRFGNIQVRSTYNYYALGEKQKILDRNGVISEEAIALEYDIHNDSRYVVDSSSMWLFGLDLKVIATPTFSAPIGWGFLIIPNFFKTSRKRGFYSTCMVKHFNHSAQLKSIETQNMMSINTAENLVYDKYTGNVLLSSLQDEFNDTLYSFNYPAHWYYEQFRELNNAEDFTIQGSIASGVFSISGSQDLTNSLVPGDIIQITNGTTTESAWVLEVNTSNVSLIEIDGTVYSGLSGGAITLSIIKSNRKNRINETMKGVVTKKEPTIVSSQFTFPENEIISSSVITHNDRNNMRCTPAFLDKHYNEVLVNDVVNPFLFGAKGDLVMESQFAWQSERINDQHAHGIRFDGTYTDYFPFYKLNPTDQKWYRINESSHPNYLSTELYRKWRNLGKVKTFDEYAKPLESVDQLNVFSSVLYGYHHGLTLVPTAQAVNAKQQDIAYDGFEDYNYYSTVVFGVSETHFDFENSLSSNVLISSEQKHSGLSSLKVLGNQSAYVEKSVDDDCPDPGNGISEGTFIADSCLCIKPFEPAPGEYVVSLWVKENSNQFLETYSNAKVSIIIDATSPQLFTASGPILDGWQRIEGVFTIPPGATTITVGLVNTGTANVYFDDLRLHPFLAGMTTVVYDPKTLLPMATHDGGNFTTFYNYDENLNQVRVRVETVEGIKTVSESEFSGQKQF